MRRRMPRWPRLIRSTSSLLRREPIRGEAIPRPAQSRCHVLPDRRRRPVRHRRLGSSQCADQGRERRADLRADQLRSAVVLEPAGHERHLQQVLLRRSRHARARVQRPAARPPRRPHDRRLGPRRRLLRHARRRRAVLPRARLALPASARRVQLARVVQRRPVSPVRRQRREVQLALGRADARRRAAGEPVRVSRRARACFIQHVDDNMEDIMELARSEAMLFKFGSGTGTDLSHAPLAPREAGRRRQAERAALVHARLRPGRRRREERRQDAPRRQDAVHQGLAPGRDGIHRVQVEGREEGPRASSRRAATSRTSTARPTARSCSRTRTSRSASPTTSCKPSRRTRIGRRTGSPTRSSPARPTRPARSWTAWPTAPGTAATPACSTTRRSTAGTPARTAAASTQSNPCSEYMFLDDTACNLASINLMKFRQAGRRVRRRAVQGGLPDLLHRPGNPGRSCQLSDAGHRPQQPPVPAARPGLLEPRQPADGGRHAVRFATKPAACAARSPRCCTARPTSPARAGRGGRAVRRVREEPRADAPRDADASRRGRGDQRRVPGVPAATRPAACGTMCWPPARVHGFRNAQATVLAPTGTISFMMDCDTTGIEPDIALVKYKQLAGGGMLKIVNQTVPLALGDARLRSAADRLDPGLHRRARHDRRLARREGRAPGRVRLCVHAAQRQAVDRLAGARR